MGSQARHQKDSQKAEALLRAEVETYDQYLTGDVYGYVVENTEGNNVDSCWSCFGLDYTKSEATNAGKWEASTGPKKIARPKQ